MQRYESCNLFYQKKFLGVKQKQKWKRGLSKDRLKVFKNVGWKTFSAISAKSGTRN
ncbi:Uncharacterized protein dnm_001950 [Desulfonema magnum]|uniref:Uncharacterized protein n=1 Tax=Desulfonema magnum TaxID=45655 RepID=A0A975BF30_9BACT|nr:Uncharacterized protein dnm_001950 [Desulfonema magnum]